MKKMSENSLNLNWDSGANRKLLVTIDKSYFQKYTSCIFNKKFGELYVIKRTN